MAKFDFTYADQPGNIMLRAEADPGHFAGDRNGFGPRLLFNLYWLYDASLPRHRPLSVQGALLWAGEHDGLRIPLQAVPPNAPIAIPVSDDQLARFEELRAGREPDFALRLEAVAQREDDGTVRILNHSFNPQRLPISRDAWAVILNRCGFGLRRMVELPPPPGGLGGKWDEASQSLALASQRLAQGHDEAAIAAVRKALERIVEAVGASVGEPRTGKGGFAPYVEKVAGRIQGLPSGGRQNPFPLVSSLLKATFGWVSGYVHEDAATSQRDEAAFALALGTALYGFAARGSLAASAAHEEST